MEPKQKPEKPEEYIFYKKEHIGSCVTYYKFKPHESNPIISIKLIHERRGYLLYIIGYKRRDLVLDGPLFIVKKGLYFGYWASIQNLQIKRFFILQIKNGCVRMMLYKEFIPDMSTVVEFVERKIKGGQ